MKKSKTNGSGNQPEDQNQSAEFQAFKKLTERIVKAGKPKSGKAKPAAD